MPNDIRKIVKSVSHTVEDVGVEIRKKTTTPEDLLIYADVLEIEARTLRLLANTQIRPPF